MSEARARAKFLFIVDDFEVEGIFVSVTDKKYFDTHNAQSDWELDSPLFAETLGLGEESEGCFTSYTPRTVEQLETMLNDHPDFYQCPLFSAFMKGPR